MTGHEAHWLYLPDLKTRAIGRYQCDRCKLFLELGFDPTGSVEGWYWEIRDALNELVGSSGNEYVQTYEPALGLLDDIREEALLQFNLLPCRGPN